MLAVTGLSESGLLDTPSNTPTAVDTRCVGLDSVAISSQRRHRRLGLPVIDWITAVLPCSHQEPIRGGRLMAVSSDGEIEWEFVKPQSLTGSHESSIQVQTRAPNVLWISGNPAKWLQGHNVFGKR